MLRRSRFPLCLTAALAALGVVAWQAYSHLYAPVPGQRPGLTVYRSFTTGDLFVAHRGGTLYHIRRERRGDALLVCYAGTHLFPLGSWRLEMGIHEAALNGHSKAELDARLVRHADGAEFDAYNRERRPRLRVYY